MTIMEKFILNAKKIWDLSGTDAKLLAIVLLVLILAVIVSFIRDAKDSRETKKEVDQFMTDNQKKISEIRIRIIKCDNLKDWANVKNWAIATANIIRSGIYDIDSNYGKVVGNPFLNDITRMVFKKEEELIRKTFKD
jgi:hypothetical protein